MRVSASYDYENEEGGRLREGRKKDERRRMKDKKRKEMSGANNEWGFPYRLFYMNLQGVVFMKMQT